MATETNISQDNGIATVKFTGRITLGSSLSLAESQINQLIENEGARKIIFDLTNVDFIDSAGLGFVVFMHGRLQEKGGQLRLANPKSQVLDLFRMTHTYGLLQIDSEARQSTEDLKA